MNGMTGYSFKEEYLEDAYISTEIKTLNSRYLDINVKLPYYLSSLELKIRDLVKSKLLRGKIEVSVTVRLNSSAAVKADLNLAKQYVDNLNLLIDNFKLKDDVRLFHLTKYEDVIYSEKSKDYEKYWEFLEKFLNENIKEIISMREIEGKAIKKDLLDLINGINSNVDSISTRISDMEQDIFNKTKEKMTELLNNNVDEKVLLNEAAVFVNRSCINEEVKRLESYIEQLKIVIEDKDDIGKKMDFICQEMHREINTIGSKITFVELTGNVISIKNDIEKMREQIRNAE